MQGLVKVVPKKILVLKDDSLGDFLMAVPFLKRLRVKFSSSRISVLASSAAREVAEACPYIDEVIEANPTWYWKQPGRLRNLKVCWQLAGVLSREKFDLVIGLRYQDRMESLLLSLIRAREKVGFSVGLSGWGITHKLRPQDLPQHEVEKNLYVFQQLSGESPLASASEVKMEIWTKPEEDKWADDFLEKAGREQSRALIGLHPGAGKPAKQWAAAHFAALCDHLYEQGQQVLVLTGAAETADWEKAARELKHPVMACLGQATVRQMAALQRRCRVFVGNDSGPTHLAVAAGTPTLCLFSGVTLAAQWGPRGTGVKVLEKQVWCKPCGLWDCPTDRKHSCMEQITVQEVGQAVEELLKSSS